MIELVGFAPEHFPVLLGWFGSDAALVQWAGPTLSYPLDVPQLQAICEEGRSDPPARLAWMARLDGAFVGHAQLRFDWRNGVAALSRIAIAPERRGQGLARQMLMPVVERAFATPGMERLELNVYDFNRAAIRSYEGLGFAVEGIRRSSVRVGEERWNTVMMALLRTEWRGGG